MSTTAMTGPDEDRTPKTPAPSNSSFLQHQRYNDDSSPPDAVNDQTAI